MRSDRFSWVFLIGLFTAGVCLAAALLYLPGAGLVVGYSEGVPITVALPKPPLPAVLGGGVLGFVFVLILILFLFIIVSELVLRGVTLFAEAILGRTLLPAQLLLLIFRNIRRNPLRTSLAYLTTFALVLVITAVWSILSFLDAVTTERANDFKVLVTEKYQIPSQMPYSYVEKVFAAAQELPAGSRPQRKDFMSWSFVGATLDPAKRTPQNSLFFFCLHPSSVVPRDPDTGKALGSSMLDGLSRDELGDKDFAEVDRLATVMAKNPKGCIIGFEKLLTLNKRVGDRVKMTSTNYKDIELELDIIGTFPIGQDGRYNQSAVMNIDYLTRAMDAYKTDPAKGNGTAHPLADKCINLIWIRLPDKETFGQFGALMNSSGKFASPAVKVETASSAIGNFLEAYKDIIKGMRYLLSPAILAVIALVIAIVISIGVRERRPEMAVLKVLGYSPGMILFMVLGEALLIGVLSGGLSSISTWALVNLALGGLKFPIAFFPSFKIADAAVWWGPTIGFGTALLGSFVPAWSARGVKVSEVFSKVT